MNPKIEALKRCKCGGKAKIISEAGIVDYVKCSKCDNQTSSYFDGIEYAIFDWNNGICDGFDKVKIWALQKEKRLLR